MKKIVAPLALLSVATLMVLVLGCDSTNTNPVNDKPLGTLAGFIQMSPNLQGSIAQTRVAIYKSLEDFSLRQHAGFAEADENGNYVIAGVAPGQYYIDAWKDVDGNGGITRGDFYSVHCDPDGRMCNRCCEPGKPLCAWLVLNVVQ